MRIVRLGTALIRARLNPKIKGTETLTNSFRVWITDVDVSIMNHAAILTIFETGRVQLMVRSEFLKVATKHKWFVPLQSISVQYYRPLKAFQKAEVHTRISYVDEKWIYIEQKIERHGKVVAACICRSTIKDGRETSITAGLLYYLGSFRGLLQDLRCI